MANSSFDLVVVGGGPAGATATLLAARAGLRALLLDEARAPRVRPGGELLGGRALATLGALGLLEEVRRLPSARIGGLLLESPSGTVAAIDLAASPGALGVRRALVDELLHGKAKEAAVEYREGFHVEDLDVEQGVVKGVRGWDVATGAVRTFRASVVLGADGARSVVARRGPGARAPGETTAAVRACYRDVAGLSQRLEVRWRAATLPGFLWIFPLGNGLASVGLGAPAAALKRRGVSPEAALEEELAAPPLAERFARASLAEPIAPGFLPVAPAVRRASGAGFLLLGDAAGLADPFALRGVPHAMLSARIAVETAQRAIREGDLGERSLARYDARLAAELGRALYGAGRLARVAASRRMLERLVGRARRSGRVRDMLAAAFSGEPARAPISSAFDVAKLLFS